MCVLAAGDPEGRKLSPIPRGGVDNLEKEQMEKAIHNTATLSTPCHRSLECWGGGLAMDDQLAPGRLEGLARRGHSTPHMTS